MSDCCSKSCSSNEVHETHRCPVNGKVYKGVSEKTILHHINEPWQWEDKQQNYYFCDDPECDVVYFGQDNSVIKKSELRNIVGVKAQSVHVRINRNIISKPGSAGFLWWAGTTVAVRSR